MKKQAMRGPSTTPHKVRCSQVKEPSMTWFDEGYWLDFGRHATEAPSGTNYAQRSWTKTKDKKYYVAWKKAYKEGRIGVRRYKDIGKTRTRGQTVEQMVQREADDGGL